MNFNTQSVKRILSGLAAVGACLLTSSANAETASVTYTSSIPMTQDNWSRSLSLPQFNIPAVHLDSVDISFTGTVLGDARVENFDAEPQTFAARICAYVNLNKPDGSSLLKIHPKCSEVSDSLDAFDGVLDYAGTSGRSYLSLTSNETGTASLTASADVAPFIGTGSVTLPVDSAASSYFNGPSNVFYALNTSSSADIKITYRYSFERASLGDKVWFDKNNNGIQDGDEPGVAGVKVILQDAQGNELSNTTTDSNGNYSFTNLMPGTYKVHFNAPSGTTFTQQNAGSDTTVDSNADANGDTATVTLASGENNITIDAGLVGTRSLGDRVWFDANRNGIQDQDEIGVAGATVVLYDANGNPIATQLTDGQGKYLFTNLLPGKYSVKFTPPTGWAFTIQGAGNDIALDSNANPTTGVTAQVTLTANQDNLTVDAGLVGLGKIGDTVWLDSDADGKYEPEIGELGIPGVKVLLQGDINNDGTVDYNAWTTTDANGKYIFDMLPPGKYKVTVDATTLPKGLIQTYDLDGVQTKNVAIGNLTVPAKPTDPMQNLDFDFGYTYKCDPCGGCACDWYHYSCYWPCNKITIGCKTYTKSEALCLLGKNDCGDISLAVFKQVLAAKLNVGIGCNTDKRYGGRCGSASGNIQDQLRAADAWLCKYPVGSRVNSCSTAGKTGLSYADILEDYNCGYYGW